MGSIYTHDRICLQQFVNCSIGISPFQAVTAVRSRFPIDLVPLSTNAQPSVEVDNFIKHMQQTHDEVRRHIVASNIMYKAHAD